MNSKFNPDLHEVEEERDDAVIGKALTYSVAAFAVLAIAGGVGYFIWLVGQKEEVVEAPKPVELPTVREAVARELPLLPFTDITEAAGIMFRHESGADGEKLLPETMGGGCAFLDYDSDGDQDILLVNSKRWPWDKAGQTGPANSLTLYQNDGQGMFTDVTEQAQLNSNAYGQGVAVGDYDNDGDPDLFVTGIAELDQLSEQVAVAGSGPHRLFRNDAGKFVDITQAAGVAGGGADWGTSTGWFDYDNDSDLDLWVCNYIVWSREFDLAQDFRLTGGDRAYGRPQAFTGTFPRLYRNDGGDRFTDVSAEAGIQVVNRDTKSPRGKSLGLAFADLDGDGWQDVIVANDTVQNFLFHNLGNGKFEEIGAQCGIAFDADGNARGAMGIDVACARDDLDCFATAIGNFSNEMTAFYVSLPGTTQFTDEAVANGLGPNTRLFLTFGVLFLDADLDGWLDLFHANGHLEEDIAKVQSSQTYEQAPQLFWNAGPVAKTEFVPLTAAQLSESFVKPMVGRGAACADIDGDGDLDLLIAATGSKPRLLRNDQQLGHNWLSVKLTGNGTTSNRDAIGARVDLALSDGRTLRRYVGPTKSYLSQSQLAINVGLGSATVKELQVTWPYGKTQTLGVQPVNSVIDIKQ